MVYIGQRNQFTKQDASKWSITKDDVVTVPIRVPATPSKTPETAE